MVKAGISDTDVFIASTGKDSLNGLAAQRALTVFGVDKVLTVVNDEDARSLYDSLGITTINKATIASNQIVQTIIAEQ
jgi:Trk K+ transport system NAD-binding subunit